MKKVFYSLLVIAGLFFTSAQTKAQTFKVGVFDVDQMLTVMPGYRAVDSLLQIYQNDSLPAEYAFYNDEYKRLDSTYKADSAKGKAPTVLDMEKQQRQQVAINIVYWQQIQQNKLEQKRYQLAYPMLQQIDNSYKKIMAAKKYSLIVKPDAILYIDPAQVDNLFDLVAKDLKIKLPQQQGANAQNDTDDNEPQQAAPQTTKPATRAGTRPK